MVPRLDTCADGPTHRLARAPCEVRWSAMCAGDDTFVLVAYSCASSCVPTLCKTYIIRNDDVPLSRKKCKADKPGRNKKTRSTVHAMHTTGVPTEHLTTQTFHTTDYCAADRQVGNQHTHVVRQGCSQGSKHGQTSIRQRRQVCVKHVAGTAMMWRAIRVSAITQDKQC